MAAKMQDVTALPQELLARIMGLVPLSQRMSDCAAVCGEWATAAAVGTLHVSRKFSHGKDDIPGLQEWLQAHGTQLLSLEITCLGQSTLQLQHNQLLQLQQLQLDYGRLQFPDSTSTAIISADDKSDDSTSARGVTRAGPLLPKLQELDLDAVSLPSPASLPQLVQGPQMTSLKLNYISFEGGERFGGTDEAKCPGFHAAMDQLLQQLPRLYVLHLGRMDIGPAAVQQLSAMERLQDLRLQLCAGMDSSCLEILPGSITKLDLHETRGSITHPATIPSLPAELPQLTALQHLELNFCAVPPALLQGFTQLRHLMLSSCVLPPVDPLDMTQVEGTAALLAALRKLTRLQHLHLDIPDFNTAMQPLPSYAALTASSQLTYLRMWPDGEGQPLPLGAVQHMFPAGKRMPLLQRLCIAASIEDTDTSQVPDWHALSAQDLSSIFSACPNLQDLTIQGAVALDADLSVLLQLPSSCTALTTGGWAFTDAAAPVLAQLTQLKQLNWYASPGLTDIGLEQLTALTALSNLELNDCKGLSPDVWTGDGSGSDMGIVELQSNIHGGPVWQQLRELCDASTVLQEQREAAGQA